MEQKKQTKAQIERKMKNAVVFVARDKDTVSVFFDDKGCRLSVTNECAVVETGFHRHVFSNITAGGSLSRPYLYTKRVVEIANENDCIVKDKNGNQVGYSYTLLLETLKSKEDKAEYNIVYFYSWWLMNIFDPLFAIGETDVETFMTYFNYCCCVAKNAVLLSEKTEGMSNKQFVEKFIDNLKSFTDNMTEAVLFEKKTDEQVLQEEMQAIQEHELEQQMQDDGSKD